MNGDCSYNAAFVQCVLIVHVENVTEVHDDSEDDDKNTINDRENHCARIPVR